MVCSDMNEMIKENENDDCYLLWVEQNAKQLEMTSRNDASVKDERAHNNQEKRKTEKRKKVTLSDMSSQTKMAF